MILRIFIALFAVGFLFGAADSASAAEQVNNQSNTLLGINASHSKKNDFRPKKRKKMKPKKRHCDAY